MKNDRSSDQFNKPTDLYDNFLNYKIVNVSNKKICYVFCSSNGLGKKTDDFKSFIPTDYFEWENISKNKQLLRISGKYIFLRDVFLRSYVDGINKNINSINDLINFVKEETKGYTVICVGSSGGGYLSMILGAKLTNCVRVYSFGGLFSLYTWTGAKNNFSFKNISAYQKHLNDPNFNQYYQIAHLLRSCKSKILHFYGKFNMPDCIQLKELSGYNYENLFTFAIKSNLHGGDIYGFSYPFLLTLDEKKFEYFCKFKREIISKQRIAINCMGLFRFYFHLLRKSFKRFIKHVFVKRK